MANGNPLQASIKTDKPGLDFSGLLDEKPGEKQGPYLPCKASFKGGQYVLPSDGENPLETILGASMGIDIETAPGRGGNVNGKPRQELKVKGGELQAELLRGVQEGTNIYRLFLQAGKALSDITDNQHFYDELSAGVKSIYGDGLQQGPVAEIELEEVQARLALLEEAERRELEADSRERIHNAIREHRKREERLKEIIRAKDSN